MIKERTENRIGIIKIIENQLTPYVKRIDQDAFYAKHYLETLGKEGYFLSGNESEAEVILKRVTLVEETAKVCMTTAFCVWCHLAAITYIENTNNKKLKQNILPKLKSGELIAGTGLSNPMKAFSNMERVHLEAEKTDGGFCINGALPAISNIGTDQAFAFIARVDDDNYIMCFIPCNSEGLSLGERTEYLGMNGSATYACAFKNVFVSEENIIAHEAVNFVQTIRPLFVTYQIPLGLGVMASSILAIEKVFEKNKSINKYIKTQSEDLKAKYDIIRKCLVKQIRSKCYSWKDIVSLRLDTVYLTLDAVQSAMIHTGGAAYLETSSASRKLREAYFLVNLTPTIKHLEKFKKEEHLM